MSYTTFQKRQKIGRQLKLPVVSIGTEEASDHFGWLSAIVSVDNPTSSTLTRNRLRWLTKGPSLIADIEQGHYFNNPRDAQRAVKL